MTDSEKFVLEALKQGETRWKDLERLLVKSGKMSKSTLSQNLQKLEREGKIRRSVDQSKKPSVAWYALTYLESHLEQKAREAVEELRREFSFFREPTVKEVAVKVGETSETLRSMLYKLASKIGWKEQEKEEAEKEAENAINLAGWLKWLEKEKIEKLQEVGEMAENEEVRGMDALQIRQIFHQKIEETNMMAEEELEKASNDALIRAKRILKEFPELVPDVYAGDGLNAWPQETKKAWFRVFGSEPPTPTRRVDDGKVIAAIKRLRRSPSKPAFRWIVQKNWPINWQSVQVGSIQHPNLLKTRQKSLERFLFVQLGLGMEKLGKMENPRISTMIANWK